MNLSHKTSWLFPCILFLLSLAVRLAFISKGPYHVDGLNLAIQAEQTLQTGKLHHLFGPGYPLTVLCGTVFLALGRLLGFTDPVTAVNMMSVFFSAGTVPLFYILVKRCIGSSAGFYSALLLSFSPIFLLLSVYATSHTVSLFFLTAGLLGLKEYQQTLNINTLLISGLLLGAMGGARIQDLILMFPALSVFLGFPSPEGSGHHPQRPSSQRWCHFFLLFGTILFTAFLWHLPLLSTARHTGYHSQFFRFWQWGLIQNFLGIISPSMIESFRYMIFGLTPVGSVVSLLGLVQGLRVHSRTFFFLMSWFLIPLAFYGNLDSSAPRFLLLSMIPLFISQGTFLAHLQSYRKPLFQAGIYGYIVITVTLLFSQTYPILKFRHTHALLPDFGRYVQTVTSQNAVIIAGDEALFIRHYGKREILARPRFFHQDAGQKLRAFNEEIAHQLKDGHDVYITNTGLYSYDPGYLFSSFIKARYNLNLVGERMSEDWHKGETRLRTGMEKLYQLELKQP
jgi:4-amino-4-deoxy-L-arabinose transferase-like glycosyltransferase